jgi:hypothetical protein
LIHLVSREAESQARGTFGLLRLNSCAGKDTELTTNLDIKISISRRPEIFEPAVHEMYLLSHLPLYDSSVALGGNDVHIISPAAISGILVSGNTTIRALPFSMMVEEVKDWTRRTS